jgi:hypothetical protein
MVTLILGRITFLDQMLDDGYKATVHSIDEVIHCESVERAAALGEEKLEIYDAYLIPSEYTGEIIYECPKPIMLF